MAPGHKLFTNHNCYQALVLRPMFAAVPVVMAIILVSTTPAMADDSLEIKAGTLPPTAPTVRKYGRLDPLLLSPVQNTVVDTPFGGVRIDKGSIVLLISWDHGVAVYDLLAKDSIELKTKSDTIEVLPGHSAVLTDATGKSFEELNPCPFICYRKLTSRPSGADNKLWEAEFDLTSVISGLPPLQRHMHSGDSVIQKKIDQMLKTDRQRMVMSPSKEPFAYYLAPQLQRSIFDPPVSSPLGSDIKSSKWKIDVPVLLPDGGFPAALRPHIDPPPVSN